MKTKTLAEQTKELFEKAEKYLNDSLITKGLDITHISNIDDETWVNFKKCFELIEACKEYSSVMAEKLDKIDSIETKLDKLLSIAEKAAK